MATQKAKAVQIPALEVSRLIVQIRSVSPLIVHNFGEKAKDEIRRKQQKHAVLKKEAKDPDALYRASMYLLEDGGYGFPAIGFKRATVRGAKYSGGVMADAKGSLFIHGEPCVNYNQPIVRLHGAEPVMREDPVRIGAGTSDLRYRAEFPSWEAELSLRFNNRVLSAEEIINMINHGGFHSGIGEWRPEKGGDFGQFEVVGQREYK